MKFKIIYAHQHLLSDSLVRCRKNYLPVRKRSVEEYIKYDLFALWCRLLCHCGCAGFCATVERACGAWSGRTRLMFHNQSHILSHNKANYMYFTRWRGLFFFPTRAHPFFSTPLAVGEWSMTDIHSHETNPKQLTPWWATIRRELTVPYHGGTTWKDFSAGTSLRSSWHFVMIYAAHFWLPLLYCDCEHFYYYSQANHSNLVQQCYLYISTFVPLCDKFFYLLMATAWALQTLHYF